MEAVTSIKPEKYSSGTSSHSLDSSCSTRSLSSHRCLLGPGTYQDASCACPEGKRQTPACSKNAMHRLLSLRGQAAAVGLRKLFAAERATLHEATWPAPGRTVMTELGDSGAAPLTLQERSTATCWNMQAAHVLAARSGTGTVVRKSCAHY